MKFKTTVLIALITMLLFTQCNSPGNYPEPSEKPNIILIYADDLGKGLLSHEGQEIIKTPFIDRLADEGIRFQNAYSCMLCAPARASLLSGKHDCHEDKFEITNAGIYKKISTGELTPSQVENNINKELSPTPKETVFLANIAKEAGYSTAQFGKLEWGFSTSDQQMKRHGWDHYFGYLDHVRAHGFYPPFLFRNGTLVEIEGNTLVGAGKSLEPETPEAFEDRWNMDGKKVYSQQIFMDSILNFITKNKENPFFIYFPTQLPHGPVAIPEIHPDYTNDNRLSQIEKEYASMVKLLDDNVGQIMEHLENLKLQDNTIVIFTSDNGHEIYYSQKGRVEKPYTNMETGKRFDNLEFKYYSDLGGDIFNGNAGRAGLKRSNLQGGVEVPLIIKWPNRIKSGTVSNQLVANYDLLATFAELTGYKKPMSTDGISFYKELLQEELSAEHDFIVFSSFTGPTLITKDGWKLRTYLSKNVFELYFLPNDYREETDLSEKNPEILDKLKEALIKACDGNLNNGLYTSQKNQLKLNQKTPNL